MNADLSTSARVIEINYETNRAVVRFEGLPPEIGDEAYFPPLALSKPLARVNDEGFIVKCDEMPLQPGMLLYRAQMFVSADKPVAQVVAVDPPGPDGHGVSWLRGAMPSPGDLLYASSSDAEFKNFHRALCARFGYTHDEVDWRRDQVSLIEQIAKRIGT